MKKMTSKFLIIAVTLFAAACSPQNRVADRQLVAEPDPITLKIASAADKASAALQTLASVEQTRTPAAAIVSSPAAPQELRRVVSVTWNGPIEPITRQLADRAGYQFRVQGDAPTVPVVVSVISEEKSVIDVLRDIGLQAGTRADVIVDPNRRLVEISYAPAAGG